MEWRWRAIRLKRPAIPTRLTLFIFALTLLGAATLLSPDTPFGRVRVMAGGGALVNIKFEETRDETPADESRRAAERACSEAERLRLVWKLEARREAIQNYERALSLWRSIRARDEEAGTLNNIGEVYFALGEPRKALTYYDEALRLSRSLGNHSREVAALNNLAYAHLSLGDPRKAAAYCSAALKLSRRENDRGGEARALDNIGEVNYFAGNLKAALTFYQQSLTLRREAGDPRGEAQTLYYLGSAYADLSEMKQAADAYQQSLSLWRDCKDERGQALTLVAIGNLYSAQGEKQKALDRYYEARQFFEPMCDPIEEARLLNGIGFVYDEMGEKQGALEFYEQALRLFRASSYRRGEATNLLNLGEIHHALEDDEKALDYCRQALAIFRELGDHRIESFALKDIGLILDNMGEKAQALDYFRQALTLNRAGADKREEGCVLGYIARVLEELGRRDESLAHYKRALSLNRAVKDRFGESATLYNIARVERARGQLDEARSHFESALELIETLRTKVASQELRTSYVASIYQHYEAYINLLMELERQRPGQGFEALALETSERARARSLLDNLSETKADIRQGVDPALLERDRDLQQTLNLKAEQQVQLLSGKHTQKEASAIAEEIDRVVGEYNEVRAQIRNVSPRYAALTQPRTLSLTEMQQQVLDDDTVLLEFSLGAEKSYLWAVTKRDITSYELPGRAAVETAARRLYEALTAPQPLAGETAENLRARLRDGDSQTPALAAALSRMLLGGVAPRLGSKRLLIVPDGALQYIPFQALPEPDAADTGSVAGRTTAEQTDSGAPAPLVRDHEIVYVSSASVLALLRRAEAQRPVPRNEVAILADPVFESEDRRVEREGETGADEEQTQTRPVRQILRDAGFAEAEGPLPRLLSSKNEAEAIMSLLPSGAGMSALGFEASRETAMSPALGDYRIVHFASHSIFNSKHQELSGIVLSLVDRRGRPQDGFLRLHDIYNLNLPADLVVLSACNTGLGTDTKGEGFVGLTRGFMYAGAAGVMASLWKVDDEATAELMKNFYASVLSEGLSPAAALKRAQMRLREQRRWRAPYYWAGFVLQGEYRARAGARLLAGVGGGSSGAAGWVAAACVLIMFSSLGGLYAVRRSHRVRST
jgi:CHAT domain-containing protein/tetratricopeptide (TPR) repeat protein